MFAQVTQLFFFWLTGPLQVVKEEMDSYIANGGAEPSPKSPPSESVVVKIERCRFIEEAQCASVCINACKLPTEQFLTEDFGIGLEIEPCYEDFSCEFRFKPLVNEDSPDAKINESEASTTHELFTPCFTQCPSKSSGSSTCPKVADALVSLDK